MEELLALSVTLESKGTKVSVSSIPTTLKKDRTLPTICQPVIINTQSDTNERQKTKISQWENAGQLPMTKILLEVLMVFSVAFRRWDKRYIKEVLRVA